ncbi:MAG: pentapeptide repeat-containing protein [Nitrospirae bacterium]|nr:MAG: pentapeptide repeat-containing protein [Nitrospirota bacterium]
MPLSCLVTSKCPWAGFYPRQPKCPLHDPSGRSLDEFNAALNEVFSRTTRGTSIGLLNIQFPNNFRASEVQLLWPGPIDFTDSTFENADFSAIEFESGVKFEKSIFRKQSTFEEAKFKGIASFAEAYFASGIDFSVAHFIEETSFKGTRFEGLPLFESTQFGQKATFISAKFKMGATFDKVIFEADVNFSLAVFSGYAKFSDKVQFKKSAGFWQVEFAEAAFLNTTCAEKMDFTGAVFNGRFSYWECLQQEMLFVASRFQAGALFVGKRESLLFSDSKYVNFDETFFGQPNLVHFQHVDLSRCSLLGVDLREIDFSLGVWRRPGRMGTWRRNVLFTIRPEKTVRAELEVAYRQIRQSFEDRRNYPQAGDFYYGEMEQRRKRSLEQGHLPLLTILYMGLSGYGQKPARALLVLLGYLVSITLLYSYLGMELSEASPYNLPNSNLNVFLYYTLPSVLLLFPTYFEPTTSHQVLITLFSKVFVPLQVAFLVLAVKRSFKR